MFVTLTGLVARVCFVLFFLWFCYDYLQRMLRQLPCTLTFPFLSFSFHLALALVTHRSPPTHPRSVSSRIFPFFLSLGLKPRSFHSPLSLPTPLAYANLRYFTPAHSVFMQLPENQQLTRKLLAWFRGLIC